MLYLVYIIAVIIIIHLTLLYAQGRVNTIRTTHIKICNQETSQEKKIIIIFFFEFMPMMS